MKSFKGFTLIELLVSMAIMISLLSVILANFDTNRRTTSLNIARNNFVSNVRRMQSASIASRDVSAGVPASAYGIAMSRLGTSYTLIADNSSGVRQPVIESVNLPTNISVNSIAVTKANGTVVNPTSIEILYTVPYGRSVLTYSGGGTSANKESDSSVRITFIGPGGVQNYVDINGITGNVNQ